MLPWLTTSWQKLNRARLNGRLPHALLLHGAEGIGKSRLAEKLAHALLCDNPGPEGNRCGQCAACKWLDAGTHPDLLSLVPEEAGKAIKVDAVRALCGKLAMTGHAGRYKVAVIDPAEALNVNAANSLLKTLEEPTDSTILILLSASPGRLPATIRSRCQCIPLAVPSDVEAERWLKSKSVDPDVARRCLKLAAGAPLKALELAQTGLVQLREARLQQLQQVFAGQLDPVQVAADWMAEQQIGLESWQMWLQDAIRWRFVHAAGTEIHSVPELQQIAETVDCRVLFDLTDRIAKALNGIGSGLNQQLVMEDLLVFWANQSRQKNTQPMAGIR